MGEDNIAAPVSQSMIDSGATQSHIQAEQSVQVDLGALFEGDECEVPTVYGPVSVFVAGDRNLPACVTVPDL